MRVTEQGTEDGGPSDWRPHSLDEARLRIDGIDDAMLALLAQRADIVRHVARFKAQSGETAARTPFRPAREIQMLRRFACNRRDPLDFDAVVAIWREIVGAFTAMQRPLEIVVLEGARPDRLLLARNAFGAAARISAADALDALFARLRERPQALGVVPLTGSGWWMREEPDGPRALCALPMHGDAVDAICIGHAPLEPSGDDVTLLATLDTAPAGDDPRILERDGPQCLIALDGYHLDAWGEAAVSAVDALAIPADALRALGAYPRPLPKELPT